MIKLLLSMAAVALMPIASQAGSLTGNIGLATDYYSKGQDQAPDSAGMVKGDIVYGWNSSVYAGVWLGSLDKGFEFDLFAGWAGKLGDVGLDVSYMTIYLTDDVWGIGTDAITQEVLVRTGYGVVILAADINIDSKKSTAKDLFIEDYTNYFAKIDVSRWLEGMSLVYGVLDYVDSKDRRYFDATYAIDLDKGLGFKAQYINSSDVSAAGGAIVFTLSKSFSLI